MSDSNLAEDENSVAISQDELAVLVQRNKDGKFLARNDLNTFGSRSHYWAKPARRNEFRRCIKRLIDIRDGRLHEEHYDSKGKKVIVVASVANVIKSIELLLSYIAGKPSQKLILDLENGGSAPLMSITLNRPAEQQVTGSLQLGIQLSTDDNQKQLSTTEPLE